MSTGGFGLADGSLAELMGSLGGPLKGCDIRTREWKKSGRDRAQREDVTAPKSWPTTHLTLV